MTEKSIFDQATEVWSRLFDHRPFLRGEIKSFVHNFELKHPDGRAPGLDEPLAQVRQIQTELVDGCKNLLAESLPSLQEDAVLVETQCRALLEAAANNEQAQDRIAALQIQREEDWGQFLSELEQLRAEVDEEFERKEAELRDYYHRAQQKLV